MLIAMPWAAFIVAAVMLALWRHSGAWIVLATAVLWGLYGVYEGLIQFGVICSGECNIRVDLLLIYPLLLLTSVIAIGLVAIRPPPKPPAD